MLDEESFANYLRKFGKKPHVVAELVQQVQAFEAYLTQQKHKALESTQAQDMVDYARHLEQQKPGSSKTWLRGLALYFRFTGNRAAEQSAGALREQGTAKTRHTFRLKDFVGVNPEHLYRLEAEGISNVQHMLQAGKTPQSRVQLAEKTGLPIHAILELVKLSDLTRLGGLKAIRARLYYDAGADTPEAIARWEPEPLRLMMADFVARTGFKGIAPLPKEVLSTINAARLLPKIVEYGKAKEEQ